MMCGLEAIEKREQARIEAELASELARKEWEERIRKNTILLCENVINPIITTAIEYSQFYKPSDWGSIIIRRSFEKEGVLLKSTTSDYVDGRKSYKYDNSYLDHKTFSNVDIDIELLKSYLNSYCWDFEEKKREEYIYGCGLVKVSELCFKPIPQCI